MEHNTYKTQSFHNYVKDTASAIGNEIFIRTYWKHAIIIVGFGLILAHLHA